MPIGTTSTLPIPTGVVTYNVYAEGQTISAGMADLTLPNIAFLVQSVTGPGILGNIDVVTPLMEAMTATLKWRVLHENQFTLLNLLSQHGLSFRPAQQAYDAGKGGPWYQGFDIRVKAAAKNLNLGNVANNSQTDTQIELAVYYLSVRDTLGAVLCEIDPVNQVFTVNGQDQLAALRDAI